MCLLMYVEEGVLGKVSASVCTYIGMKSQRAPLVPFHLEVKRDKTVKPTDFFFNSKRRKGLRLGRRKRRRNGWRVRKREGRNEESRQAGRQFCKKGREIEGKTDKKRHKEKKRNSERK